MFLPTTAQELKKLGWDRPDIILVTGDAYIDSPHVGVAVIGKYLLSHGFKTAVIAQPSLQDGSDIARLGEPKLFWGVTAGCIDSMVANYTPLKKWRKQDDYTPGGVNARPDRATIAYTNLIRRNFKETKPVVLGGIEASLRRVAHYDYWGDDVRRSILFDAKADILVYGMAEHTVVALARALREGDDWKNLPGLCYISREPVPGYIPLPPFEKIKDDRHLFMDAFQLFSRKFEEGADGFVQKHGDRYLVHTPPAPPYAPADLDEVYALDFEREAHPYYRTGEIRALETIRQSVTTHRGCFGQCSFCAIAAHQGRRVVSRSRASVLAEVRRIAARAGFNGIIYDVGGPTANMYATVCRKGGAPCALSHCLLPQPCPSLSFGHRAQVELLDEIVRVPGIKRVFISSGIRHDLVVADREHGELYVDKLVARHVSGQIKLAPEHYDNEVLALMRKPSIKPLMRFKEMFEKSCREQEKRHFMTYYLMAAHPGCTMDHMHRLKDFLKGGLHALPEQVQIFTPTPSTLSAAMYRCGTDPEGRRLFCERHPDGKQRQKDLLRRHDRSSGGPSADGRSAPRAERRRNVKDGPAGPRPPRGPRR